MSRIVSAAALAATAFVASFAFAQQADLAATPSPLLQVDRHRVGIVDGILATWQYELRSRYDRTRIRRRPVCARR